MGRGPEQTRFQRGHTDGPQVHEKTLGITSHQGRADGQHRERAPAQSGWRPSDRLEGSGAGRKAPWGCWERETVWMRLGN